MPHKSRIIYRNFNRQDTSQWIRIHGIVSAFSHAWIFVTNYKPSYKNESIELVAEKDGSIIGFIDVEIEPYPGKLCLKAESRGGFVWEFGVLPEMQKKGVGRHLIRETEMRLAKLGINRMEFFTRDNNACKFYESMAMEKISTHYQFFFKAPHGMGKKLIKKGLLSVNHVYANCWVDEWEHVKRQFDILYDPPYEPHICYGFEHRF